MPSWTGFKKLSILFLLILLVSPILMGVVKAEEEVIVMVEGFAYEEKTYDGIGPGKIWYQHPYTSNDKYEVVYTDAGYVYKITAHGGSTSSIYGEGYPHLFDKDGNYVGPDYYEFKVKMMVESGCGGIIIRVRRYLDQTYRVYICPGSDADNLILFDRSMAVKEATVNIDYGKWYYLYLRFWKGNEVAAKLEGNGVSKTLTYVDDNPLPPGTFGVFALGQSVVYFDAAWLTVIMPEATTTTATVTETKIVTETVTQTETVTETETVTAAQATTVTETTTETTTVTEAAETVTETETVTTTTHLTETTTVSETSTPSEEEFDFNLAVAPSTLTLKPGQSASAAVTVNKVSGEPQTVTLTALGLPSDFTATFSPQTLKPDGTSILMVKAGASPGTYTMVVQAQGGGKTKQAQLKITVEEERRCLIATAAFGSEIAPQVQALRTFRDGFVMKTFAGRNFMKAFNTFYYSWSPYIAEMEYRNQPLRNLIKASIYPLLLILELSRQAAKPFTNTPELAVLISGLTASFLIGLTYLAPPILTLWLILKLKGKKTNPNTTYPATALSLGLISFIAAELSASSALMIISSSTIVLSTIALAAITPLKLLEAKSRSNIN